MIDLKVYYNVKELSKCGDINSNNIRLIVCDL